MIQSSRPVLYIPSMLSKFLKARIHLHNFFIHPSVIRYRHTVKKIGGLPRTEYDTSTRPRRPNKLNLGYALRVHWELWPLVIVTAGVVVLITVFSVWASQNKVDVIYTRKGSCISRTMDLCHPTVHKLYTINQRYEPWPELVAVLTKMKEAENRLKEEEERAKC